MQFKRVKDKAVLEELRKKSGSHYTPQLLANFIAKQIAKTIKEQFSDSIKILDPAVGDGELIIAILSNLAPNDYKKVCVTGFDTDQTAITKALSRTSNLFPDIPINLFCESFVDISQHLHLENHQSLFAPQKFNIVIANPPYVRTQNLGASKSQHFANTFGLTGRVDLYHVFICGIAAILCDRGIAGLIVSNRFMTTKSGAEIRRIIQKEFEILHVWDLGDTRLFEAAVLPAVLLLRKKDKNKQKIVSKFTSIYSIKNKDSEVFCNNAINALEEKGIVQVDDGQSYLVQQGELNISESVDTLWRVSTEKADSWLSKVKQQTYCQFKDIGKIRVGVKTTADKVFIRSDWDSLPDLEQPELLKPLITHHIARRFRAYPLEKKILYTHHIKEGKRAVIDIQRFPKTQKYLNSHKVTLEARDYVIKGGRNWFEIWVPQNPAAWSKPKIVFRDITETPVFWMDLQGSIVNGDCYWLTNDYSKDDDLLWLCLAVGNSSFIEVFYDHSFNNKLYAGRRRFMTQYVEKFPLPKLGLITNQIVKKTKKLYSILESSESSKLENEINILVWKSFSFSVEEMPR
jgi:adenine-specific DNA-methyltransferase